MSQSLNLLKTHDSLNSDSMLGLNVPSESFFAVYPTPDMLLGVTNFSLQPSFAPQHNNNNHEHLNANHSRQSSNGKGESIDSN